MGGENVDFLFGRPHLARLDACEPAGARMDEPTCGRMTGIERYNEKEIAKMSDVCERITQRAADRARVDRCGHVDGGRDRALDGRRSASTRISGSSERALATSGVSARDVLPDVGRIKTAYRTRWASFPKACLDKLLDAMAGASFKVCKDQTYALCAAARCNVFDGVAYCQCDVKHGDSISLPFPMGKDEDVCSINAAGANNKYMVSTYSLPDQIASPQGGSAVYTCPAERGLAPTPSVTAVLFFRSTEETTFPGLR